MVWVGRKQEGDPFGETERPKESQASWGRKRKKEVWFRVRVGKCSTTKKKVIIQMNRSRARCSNASLLRSPPTEYR
ncbi:hypothetical protein IF1G_01648 [Cordyceps javanica]|uniref:Uncharacterized protein n=1 Tax=Cordyceps javanica TaxID=43265 RepID=A0A545VCJ6_9HYPO|nr:hypothetical protein IF1G_01648 [Cordyceps javanica]